MKYNILVVAVCSIIGVGTFGIAQASHTWGGYHWARTANPFTLQIGDNVSLAWDSYLSTTASDWSLSSMLDMVINPGKTTPRQCKPSSGRIEVCNEKYGSNGWLGIAQIWINGSHITQGTVKLNDTYFRTATYNTPAWKNLVMCQEVGHILGLDHQDENFSNGNLGTCMDYTNSPATNQHPNQHDYDMLTSLYTHLDTITTVLASATKNSPAVSAKGGNAAVAIAKEIDMNNPSAWGKAFKQDAQGNNSLYARDLGNGQTVVTHVTWIEGHEEAE